jgi:asparagine synthase (glutamine-hydrolysing)
MLDPDLASLTMKLPDSALVLGNVQKRILRDAVRRHLPDAVFEHPKTGFSIPLHHFQNQEFAEIARDLMAKRDGPMALLDQGITKSYVDRGLSRRSDRADYSVYRASHQLWALMQLSGWSTRFGVIL